MVDPYVYAHLVNENDNGGQAAIMKGLASLAKSENIAIALVHHAKKPTGNVA